MILMNLCLHLKMERPNPPVPGKITHYSVELFWKIPRSKEGRTSVTIQQQPGQENEFETIYTGFGKKCEAKELQHETAYKFRMKFTTGNQSTEWSALTDVTTKDRPMTGDDLHRVVASRSTSGLKKLLDDEDIEIDAPDKMGHSPLMNSCVKGFDEISEILLDHGADVNFSNSSGKNSGGGVERENRIRSAVTRTTTAPEKSITFCMMGHGGVIGGDGWIRGMGSDLSIALL
eukprot:sb/3469379/